MKPFYILSFCILAASCNKSEDKDDSCNGNTRREVKILSDQDAASINFTPVISTIDSIENLIVQEPEKDTPRMGIEKQVYTITAKVDKVKKEPDGDYHIRLVSGDSYMIVEVPNIYCEFVQDSPFKDIYRTVRTFVQQNELEEKTITVTGVAYVDIDHPYKRKQAKNNMELHPLLDIHF